MPLKDADLYGMLMRRPVDQRKGLLKVSISYYQDPALRRGNYIGMGMVPSIIDVWGYDYTKTPPSGEEIGLVATIRESCAQSGTVRTCS